MENTITPLTLAIFEGNLSTVESLIANGADVNVIDSSGVTPLQMAILHHHSTIAKKLLEKGADPNIAGTAGRTPLDIAAAMGDVEILVELVKHNGDVKVLNIYGCTILYSAAAGVVNGYENCWNVIKWLLEHKRDDIDFLEKDVKKLLEREDRSYLEEYNKILKELGY